MEQMLLKVDAEVTVRAAGVPKLQWPGSLAGGPSPRARSTERASASLK